MNVVITIPDKFAVDFQRRGELSRQMLESFAVESYRREDLSLGQFAELLNLSIDEANALLKKHDVPLNYSLEDFQAEQNAVEMFLGK